MQSCPLSGPLDTDERRTMNHANPHRLANPTKMQMAAQESEPAIFHWDDHGLLWPKSRLQREPLLSRSNLRDEIAEVASLGHNCRSCLPLKFIPVVRTGCVLNGLSRINGYTRRLLFGFGTH